MNLSFKKALLMMIVVIIFLCSSNTLSKEVDGIPFSYIWNETDTLRL